MLTGSTGPMARSVRDCAIAMQVMAGPDGRDMICIQNDPPDYLARIDAGVEGLRLAWTEDFGYASAFAVEETPRVLDVTRSAAMQLASLGAVVEPTDEVWEDPRAGLGALAGAFASVGFLHPTFLARSTANARRIDSAAGLPAAPDADAGRVAYEQAPPLAAPSSDEYEAATESRARNWDRFRRLFGTYDVLLSATAPMVTRPVQEWGVTGANFMGGAYLTHTAMFNVLGFPAVSVPCGFVDGLPVGLQIVSWPGREDMIFRVATAVQQAFPQGPPPLA